MAFDFKEHYGQFFDKPLRIDTPAKINLRLKLLGLREDGYHYLSMLNVPTDLSDRVWLYLLADGPVNCIGQPEFMGECMRQERRPAVSQMLRDPGVNLAALAARKFFDTFRIPLGANLDIHKDVPVGAGLGGGSSNAGGLLEFLRKTFQTYLSAEHGLDEAGSRAEVLKIALALGADVPYFLTPVFAWVKGVGETVEPLSSRAIGNYPCLLIIPDEEIPTGEVYKRSRVKLEAAGKKGQADKDEETVSFAGRYGDFIQSLSADMESSFKTVETLNLFRDEIKSLIKNELEASVFEQSPKVKEIIGRLRSTPNCLAAVSGSGSSVLVLSQTRHIVDVATSNAVVEALKGLPVIIRPTILNPAVP